jgi:hypothetical protein
MRRNEGLVMSFKNGYTSRIFVEKEDFLKLSPIFVKIKRR